MFRETMRTRQALKSSKVDLHTDVELLTVNMFVVEVIGIVGPIVVRVIYEVEVLKGVRSSGNLSRARSHLPLPSVLTCLTATRMEE